MPQKTIPRKIHFYHLRMQSQNMFNPSDQIDIPSMLERINVLPFKLDQPQQNRYWHEPGGRIFCCWVDGIQRDCCRIRLARIRQDYLPQIERQGNLSPLTLGDDEGFAEVMHAVFFPDGIIGAEHNYFGPRVSHLIAYLMAKDYQYCPKLAADLLLKQDAVARLQGSGGITLLRLKMVSSYIAAVKEADESLGAALAAIYAAGEPDVIELVLQNRGKHPLLSRIKETMLKLFRREDFAEEVEKVEIRGLGDTDDVDILGDTLIISQRFNRTSERERQVVSEEMYKAIQEGYHTLKDE